MIGSEPCNSLKVPRMRWVASVACVFAAVVAAHAFAQEPPARAARLAYIEGAVSIQLTSDSTWTPASINTPLAAGYSVFTEPGARAEVRVSGTAIRLAEGTEIEISRLDDDNFRATVTSGTANVHVRLMPRERYVFATPQAILVVDSEGTYRIDYDPVLDESHFVVASGSAHMEGGVGNIVVKAGQSLRMGGGTDPSLDLERAPDDDEFDHWARSRDAGWRDAAARRYVSPYMTGYEDLDANGTWSSDPDYGPAWTPSSVAATWSPYSDGHWIHVQPWGWTWVDNASWGYAPFHYGRWVFANNRWSWCPGRRIDRPVYAPAVVGWTGSAAGPSATGWYPLAPWERFQPWYRATPAHADRVNTIVRDQPPRDWHGPPDAWRNWNRDHASRTVAHDSFSRHDAIALPAPRKPAKADAPGYAREAPPKAPPHPQQQAPAHPPEKEKEK